MKKVKENSVKGSKKNRNWIALLLLIIISAISGFVGGRILVSGLEKKGDPREVVTLLIWLLVCFYLTILIQIIVHEGGHFVFGKACGYQFVSFRIGNLMIVSVEGKYKLKKFKIVGTGGQCLMMPPDCDGYNFPYVLYNMGGVLANIALSIICLLTYLFLSPNKYLSVFLILSFVIGIIFALMNGIPLKLGGMANDGYNAVSLGKDKDARHVFWIMLYINGLLASGTRMRDMPIEWFEFNQNSDLQNPLNCYVGILRCAYLNDRKQFEEANELCEYMLERAPGLLEVHKNELRCELLFYEIIGLCRDDEIEVIYSKQLQKYIKATSSYVSRRRLLYAYELLVKHDDVEAINQLKAFEKVSKTYPYLAEIESEREMIEYIKEVCILKHLPISS